MSREQNTDQHGSAWTEATKLAVWKNSFAIPGLPASEYRRDKCGNTLKWSEFGNRNSTYGWEIDHIMPVARHGNDHLTNLQVLYWRNNVNKSDNINWSCPFPKFD